jgi:Na+-transporting NADH:ubiquinone oxidoreductase subunit NqrC
MIMGDKNIALVTLAAALVSAIVVSVMAYKLNNLQNQVGSLTNNPVSAITKVLGG